MTETTNLRPDDCETLRALIPAYSVGATDPDETALVERLLPDCPEVAAELEAYQAMAQALMYTVPRSQPPAALHDKLMAAARASSSPSMTVRPAQPAPAIPAPVPQPTLVSRPRPVNRIILAAALIAAALLVISNVYWVTQVSNLNSQQQTMTALLRNQEDALTSLGTGKANRVQLVSTSGTSGGVLATVLWTPQSPTALIYTDTLPQLSAGKTYQLWFIQDSKPVSAGIFSLDQLGVGVLVFNLDHPMSDYSAVAISTEPAGGSSQPTSTPIAAAQLG
ncbi:MAG TPA: anti-sigma factor [Phototrophicaceae bacterium]|nr:anti-sigma factor [Phototrophicaceae bacterium]